MENPRALAAALLVLVAAWSWALLELIKLTR